MSHEKMLKSAGLPDERVQLLDNEGHDALFDLRPWPGAGPLDLIARADARLGPAVGLRPTHGGGDKLWSPAQRQLYPARHPALKR